MYSEFAIHILTPPCQATFEETDDSGSEGEFEDGDVQLTPDTTKDDIALIAKLSPSALRRISDKRLLRFCSEKGYLDNTVGDDGVLENDPRNLDKSQLVNLILNWVSSQVQIHFNRITFS